MREKEVYTGRELKHKLQENGISSYEWHTYEGMLEGMPEELEDEQLYRLHINDKKESFGVFKVKVVGSIKELLAFRERICNMDFEQALEEVVEWEYFKGDVLLDLLKLQKQGECNLFSLTDFYLASELEEVEIECDAWYYAAGGEIKRSTQDHLKERAI